jgi:hypothetical protein
MPRGRICTSAYILVSGAAEGDDPWADYYNLV